MSDEMERLVTMAVVFAAPVLFLLAFEWSSLSVWP